MNADKGKGENRKRKIENGRAESRALWRFGSWGNRELSFDACRAESCYPAGSAEVELAVIGWRLRRI
jgi:hypothetical protein